MLAWEKETAPHRAQRLSAIYERRGDYDNAKIWEGWRVANLRPLFEPVLWFQKPYKTGGTIADNVLEHCAGAWNEYALTKYNAHDDTCSNIIKVKTESTDHRNRHSSCEHKDCPRKIERVKSARNSI